MIIEIKGFKVLIDDEDLSRVRAMSWFRHASKRGIYFAHTSRDENRKVHTILLHRFIVSAPDGLQVDHKDGNTLNNQKVNLRLCSHVENCWNKRSRKKTISGLKGAFFERRTGRWYAQIKVNNKRLSLGTFDTAGEAHAAYCDAARKHHGEFASDGERSLS